jgi:hypothetical protein
LNCIRTLNIADLNVSLVSKYNYLLTDAYVPFVIGISEKPTFLIDITRDRPFFNPEADSPPDFDSGGTWKLYKKSDRQSLVISGNRRFSFERTGTTGTIFCEKSDDAEVTIRALIFPFDQLLYVNLLTNNSGIIAHACGIIDNGKVLVFVGASGSGKSSMAKLFMDEPNCTILNDDRIIIREIDEDFFAFGTPWHGDVPVCNRGKVILDRLFFLRHAEVNYAKRISSVDATTRLIVRSFPAIWDRDGMDANLDFMAKLTKNIPCYELGFVLNKSIITFLRDFRDKTL